MHSLLPEICIQKWVRFMQQNTKLSTFFPKLSLLFRVRNLMTKATSLQKHKHKLEINTYCYFWIPHTDVFFTKNLRLGIFLSELICLTLLTWIFHFTIFSLNFDWSMNKGGYTKNRLRSVKIYSVSVLLFLTLIFLSFPHFLFL